MNEEKKVVLDKGNKVISGVGSGIGKYLGVDPVFVRVVLLFVLFNVGLVWGVVFYGLTYWLLSNNEEQEVTEGSRVNVSGEGQEASYYESEPTYVEEEFELEDIMVNDEVNTQEEQPEPVGEEPSNKDSETSDSLGEEPEVEEEVIEEGDIEEPEIEEEPEVAEEVIVEEEWKETPKEVSLLDIGKPSTLDEEINKGSNDIE